jgi:predicted O-methyltransferase YrrM
MTKGRESHNFEESRYGIPYLRSLAEMQDTSSMRGVDLNSIRSFGRVASAYDCPSQTGVFQRLFLFGLVVSRQPKRVLELGFRFGGTSFVIMCALKDAGNNGKLVALDPRPEPGLDFSEFGKDFFLYKGSSPQDVKSAVEVLGGKIDFCHIDADHAYEAVLTDLLTVKEYMEDDSYILLHDACWPDVKKAIHEFLERDPDAVNCGMVDPYPNEEGWGGMHLLRLAGKSPSEGRPSALWRPR